MNKHSKKNIIQLSSGLNKVAKVFKLKSIEEELEQSKSNLSLAYKGTEHGEWSWNVITDVVDLSPDAQAILGYEKKEKRLEKEPFLSMIHPDDKFDFLHEIEKHKTGVIDYVSVDIRMKSAYGDWNWINVRGKFVEFDRTGAPQRFTGINYDIDEQRQYDDDVQELQEKVIELQEEKKEEKQSTTHINKNLDGYSSFRLNGLRNLLEYD
jgi:PAS domain S-box-containing protein